MEAERAIREIILPETEPPTEWILGRPVQKVSPKRRHAVVQAAVAERLRAWARGRGQVGTEWRFRVTPPGEVTRPLIPDVAFLSYERMNGLSAAELDTPAVAPEIVVEIVSADDRALDVDHKRDVYLRAGARLVLIIDPEGRRIDAYDAVSGYAHVSGKTTYVSHAFPGFTIAVAALFAETDVPSVS